ncbi:hypothetical protein CL622_00145 [archaeon]|nr:hypothetical protein [archaeon]|tara:strand:- start:390 stop:698 length:309 start_codon:yes stop_codon:yes gene_type:complete
MKDKKLIIKRYQGKLLGVEATRECKDFFVEDFLNIKKLVRFISDLYDHETAFTKTGFKFLEEYYGIDEIVKILKKEEPDFPYDIKMTAKDYLYSCAEYALDE